MKPFRCCGAHLRSPPLAGSRWRRPSGRPGIGMARGMPINRRFCMALPSRRMPGWQRSTGITGTWKPSSEALQNLLRFQPQNAAAQYRLGLLLSVTNLDLALIHLEQASQLNAEYKPVFDTLRSALVLANLKPSGADRSVTMGRALGLVGEWDLAALAFRQAVELDGRNAQAWAWLGEAQQHLGEDGLAELDHAMALDSQSVIVRGLRGLYWRRIGNEAQSLLEYKAAAATEPQNPAWAAALGELHARLGDLVAALADYQRAVQLAPNDPTYWRLLASFCAEYNLQIEAVGLPAAQKAVELSAEDPLNLATLGWLQLGAGQPHAAKQTLLKAVEARPEDALVHYHLALAYLQTGDRAAARAQLEAAVRLDAQGAAGAQAAQVLKQQFP